MFRRRNALGAEGTKVVVGEDKQDGVLVVAVTMPIGTRLPLRRVARLRETSLS